MTTDPPLTPAGARDLLERTHQSSQSALTVPTGTLLAVWGLALTGGHLVIWWATREQDPYVGPPSWALAVFGVALSLAIAVTAAVVTRAARGVHGVSSSAGIIYSLTWGVSFVAYFIVMAALGRDGIPDGTLAKVAALIPLLLVATIYLASATPLGAPALAVAGGSLAATAAVAAWFDPATMALVIALGSALSFTAGVVVARRSR